MRDIGIVGHGPSLSEKTLGEQIDQHEIVIRFKRLSHLLKEPERYGTKTDAVCSSLVVGPQVQDYWPDVKTFFLFTDSRNADSQPSQHQAVGDMFVERGNSIILDHALCQHWDYVYRTHRGDGPGHGHTSAGFHCLMYVGKYLSPCKVTLYGFDSVSTGEWTWSLSRGPDWKHYPDHRFDIEHKMLEDLKAAYMMTINTGE